MDKQIQILEKRLKEGQNNLDKCRDQLKQMIDNEIMSSNFERNAINLLIQMAEERAAIREASTQLDLIKYSDKKTLEYIRHEPL